MGRISVERKAIASFRFNPFQRNTEISYIYNFFLKKKQVAFPHPKCFFFPTTPHLFLESCLSSLQGSSAVRVFL